MRAPCRPRLYEPYIRDARDYVRLAEKCNGPIERPVFPDHIWGDALAWLERIQPALRLLNLETSITTSGQAWPGKAIHYRMNPQNAACLESAAIDVCTLANNHVLDWGYPGLEETLVSLAQRSIRFCGAGANLGEARQPAFVEIGGGNRVLVVSCGMASSGIPGEWAASGAKAGVFFLADYSSDSLDALAETILPLKQPGDLIILSIHWGDNWGYALEPGQREFAHALIATAGVDLICDHSSHHPRGVEVHRGKLILYGCGDFINDYEGIRSHEQYRDDLRLMYFPSCDPDSGVLKSLLVMPLRARRFRLRRATRADCRWLLETLNRAGVNRGCEYEIAGGDTLSLKFRSFN